MAVDEWVVDRLHDLVAGKPALVDGLRVLTTLGKPELLMVVAAIAGVVLAARRRVVDAAFVVIVAPLGWWIDIAVKHAVGRDRPVLDDPVAVGTGYSFPSGHAMVATVVYGALVLVAPRHWRRPLAVAAAAVVLVVAFTRVALGVHYPSDVLGGIVLGGIVLAGANLVAWRRRPVPARSSASGRSASPSPRPPRS